jgi:LSD1 subclass zinc finger protein
MSATSPPPKIACPHCQAMIKAPALAPGSQVNCPKCSRAFRLGEPAGSQEPGARGQESGARSQEPGVRGQGTGTSAQTPARQASRPTPPPPPRSAVPPRKLHNSVDPKVAPLDPGEVKSTRPLAPLPAMAADDGFVPLDAPAGGAPGARSQGPGAGNQAAAAAGVFVVPPPATKGEIIDPNLLPPPPPRKKPKVTHVAVVCSLCRTRLHAPLEKVGQTIQCPDCHTVNEIKPLQGKLAPKSKGPSLENAEEFELSTPVERPAYRPMQAARGEYEVLSALDPASVEHGWTLPAAGEAPGSQPATKPASPARPAPPAAKTPAASAPAANAPAANVPVAEPPTEEYAEEYAEPEEEEEFVISAPVERLEYKPPPVKLPPPDPDASLYDGRYEDEYSGTGVNRKSKDAWKRAPFLIGIVEFLFQRDTLLRWVLYAMGAAVLAALANTVTPNAGDDYVARAQNQALMYVCAVAFGIGFMGWVAPFAVCCLAIVEDTANGADEITSWPDYNFLEWFTKAAYFPIAGVVAGFPGLVIGSFIVSSGGFPPIVVLLGVLASWVFLFPLVLGSMLAENSIFAFYSATTFKSLKVAADAWMMFYVYMIFIGFLAAVALAVASIKMFIISSVGATVLVVLAFVYCRLMGRLMWVVQGKLAAAAPDEE